MGGRRGDRGRQCRDRWNREVGIAQPFRPGKDLDLHPGIRQKPEKGMCAGAMARFLTGKQSLWFCAGLRTGEIKMRCGWPHQELP